MLGTRTLRKGGVMIRWLGHLGRCVGTSYHASFWSVCAVCSGCVLGHLLVNNDVHLHFPLYYHDVVVVMSCNFPPCLLYVSHARIDPVGSHAPHQRFKDSYGYYCDKNRQYEDNELLRDSTCGTSCWALADVSGQWPGKHGVI